MVAGRYSHGSHFQESDNSNTGYAVLGLIYAQNKFGIAVPQSVKDGLNNWVDYIQCDANGGSGYVVPCDWVNILKTGNLLYEMAFEGDTAESARAQAAVNYIENHWNDPNWDPGWKGSGSPHFQATYTTMKGFDSMGIETITVSGSEVDWFDEMSTAIVQSQNADGSWPWDSWGDQLLATEWALLNLERTVEIPFMKVYVDILPGFCPNRVNTIARGVITVAVLGTEDFDVASIDPQTIILTREGVEGEVAPIIRWSYMDVAAPYDGDLCGCHSLKGDGRIDLVLMFNTQGVVGGLELEDLPDGTLLPLTLKGNLKEEEGGTPIEGQDCVWVVNLIG